MNTITINVNGLEYKLRGEETTEYLSDIAREIDEKIREMINSNKNFTLQSSSILLSINYCDQNRKLIKENSDLKNKIVHIEKQNEEIILKNNKLEEEIKAYNILMKQEKENIFNDFNEVIELEKEIEILKETLKKFKEENNKLKYDIENNNKPVNLFNN